MLYIVFTDSDVQCSTTHSATQSVRNEGEEINKLEKGPLGEYMCKVSPQSVQPFWRRRFKKKKI